MDIYTQHRDKHMKQFLFSNNKDVKFAYSKQ